MRTNFSNQEVLTLESIFWL